MTVTRTHTYPASTPPGVVTIRVTDGNNTAEAQITILDPNEAVVTVSPSPVTAGQPVTISGSVYPPNATGTLTITSAAGGEPILTQDVQSDNDGNVAEFEVVIPLDTEAGNYTVQMTLANKTGQAPLVVEGVAQQLPTPTGLAATAAPTAVTLNWTAVEGADGYVVRWKEVAGTTWTERTLVAATTDTVDGLTTGTEYEFQVKAHDSTGTMADSEWSASVLSTPGGGGTATLTPDKTTVDSAGDATARTITVSGTGWPASAGGQLALRTGAPGSGGNSVSTGTFTTDANGEFTGATIVVREQETAGDYHLTGTSGTVSADNTAITVTGGTGAPTTIPDKDVVDSTGTEPDRTITVDGTGWPASGTGTVALNSGAPGSGGTEVVSAPVTVDAQGAFADIALIVPENQAAGPYHIVTTVGAATSDNTPINVTDGTAGPAISPDKTSVDSGAPEADRTINVTGTDWAANAAVTLALNTGAPGTGGTQVATANATADGEGAFPATPLIVPEQQATGDYHIIATGADQTSDNTAITVTAGGGAVLTADKPTVPNTGDAATRTVNATGAGFPVSTAGRVAVMTGAPGSGGTEVVGADVTTDAEGNFPATALEVPDGQAAGAYHITGVFGAVTSDNTALAVTDGTAVAALTPDKETVDSTGTEGDRTIAVTGTGWTPNATVTVALNTGAPGSGGTEVVSGTGTADAQGALAAVSLIVPEDQAAGDYHLLGSDGDLTADANAITVTGGAAAAALTPDKTTVDSAGTEGDRTIAVTGTGWTPNATVTVALNTGAPGSGGTEVVSATGTAGPDGVLPAVSVIVPADQAAGDYHLLGGDGTLTADANAITVTGAAPEAAITTDKSTISVAGDETARTFNTSGTGFPANATVTIGLYPGAPGSGGTMIIGEDQTADAQGAVAAFPMIVDAGQAPGDYHVMATAGEVVVDNTPMTITA